MQTILGSGGAIGIPLAKELTRYTQHVRLVSRNPKKVNETDELVSADITQPDEISRALQGSRVVYLTVGLPYKLKVWRLQWPPLVRSVLDECRKIGARLVFLDNVYSIGADHIHHITEDSPVSPTSRKGEVRAELHRMITNAIESGDVQAMIVRSADFYGPVTRTSQLMLTVYERLARGKKAQWMFNPHARHTFTYSPDAAAAVAKLGNTVSAYQQIWNAPTSRDAKSGEEWIRTFARAMGASDRYQVISAGVVRALSLAVPLMRELYEMRYQFERDYVFDSSKYERAFGVVPTAPEDAVQELVRVLGAQKR